MSFDGILPKQGLLSYKNYLGDISWRNAGFVLPDFKTVLYER